MIAKPLNGAGTPNALKRLYDTGRPGSGGAPQRRTQFGRFGPAKRFARPGATLEERLDTFPRLLLHHARVRPNHPATREKDLGIWQTWTWAEVADEVRALACGLAAQGFRRGMHLAIIGDNRPRLYWAMIAADALGGIPVPMYQDAPAAEFVYVLNDAAIVYAIA